MWLIAVVTVLFGGIIALVFLDPFDFPAHIISASLPAGTLLLAYIAVLTIIHGNMRGEQIRKRSLLIEIDEWARNGHKILSGYLPKQTWRDRNNTLRLLAEINARKSLIVSAARLFGDSLQEEIRGAVNDLDTFGRQLESRIEDLEFDNIEYTNMDVLQEHCDKSLIKVFETTSGIRTGLGV